MGPRGEHGQPDDLALLALGEHHDSVDESHLAGCAQCQAEVDQLRAVVSSARAATREDVPQAPPAHVWEAVVAELGLGSSPASSPTEVPPAVAADRAGPRRRTLVLAAAAAAVGLLVGSVVTGLLVSQGGDGLPVLASTNLTVLADDGPGGDAEVLRNGSGRVLELDLPQLRPAPGYYEVWLLGADGQRLVSVGLLDLSQGSRARFPLPDDVDLAEFPVVDVSLEPADGNPAHSGNSIVRGTLTS